MLKMMLKKKFDSKKKGFTLIEVIVVIVIIAILAAIAVPSLTRYISSAEQKQVQSMAHNIQVVLQAEMTENYDKDFTGTKTAPVKGSNNAYAGGSDSYAKILAANGVALDDEDDLTGIAWDGRVLAGFTYTGAKYNITYVNTTGFGEVKEN